MKHDLTGGPPKKGFSSRSSVSFTPGAAGCRSSHAADILLLLLLSFFRLPGPAPKHARFFRAWRKKAPTYARVPDINTHPLVTHPFIQLPWCSSPQEEQDILLRVQNHMVDSHDYVRCCDVGTDWKAYGLSVPSPKRDLLGNIVHMPLPKGRAFMHRTGAVFVRVAPAGMVLLPNVHWRDNGEHADQPPGRNRQLQKRLWDELNNLVVVTHNAHTVANSIISEAMDNVLSHISSAK